ncbi:uncharacterized protein TRIADDRAFT_54943 [Trichoplax adhaerens]|uniref:Doublecortin domain-containing protein n=1 Tax=Trichoplax adhaerens TaxID=10228 RepID=B3RTF1_TRIAD|nr:hypothetical protein TRIADDRAFT_54943 [Trichoplax adhaerens]EDV27213.1 hypothetical protein TRIADDRAFT_54943 [Trichoplax adhaerens]|eukprot:XP_002111209.1 hypothetical protein TRIADDRAFT_54943 [Trichoplax adhaerens]
MASKKSQDVTSRLTDSSKYTGSHKNRFDDSGKGLGKAGRENMVDYTGSTSSQSRDFAVNKSNVSKSDKPVVASALGKEKFGTQMDKPISVILYRNGDKHHTGEKLVMKKEKFRTFDQMLQASTNAVRLTTGPVKKIYKAPELKKVMKNLTDFENNGKYLCCSGEPPASKEKLSPSLFQ